MQKETCVAATTTTTTTTTSSSSSSSSSSSALLPLCSPSPPLSLYGLVWTLHTKALWK